MVRGKDDWSVGWAELGLDPVEASAAVRARIERDRARIVLLAPERILFTQRSVSSRLADGRTLAELAESLRGHGWHGEPMHLVEVAGRPVSLDNRRLWAARVAGLAAVPCVLHEPAEPLAGRTDWPSRRRERARLTVDIVASPTGEWAVGGPGGMPVYQVGAVPATFGEAALFRAASQRSLLPGRLLGSETLPVPLDLSARNGLITGPSGVAGAEARTTSAREPDHPLRPVLEELLDRMRHDGQRAAAWRLPPSDQPQSVDGRVADYFGGAQAAGPRIEHYCLVTDQVERYPAAVADIVSELGRDGLRLVEMQNRWREGNRRHGLVCSMQSSRGTLLSLELHTEASWAAVLANRSLHQVSADSGESAPRRVHAVLAAAVTGRAHVRQLPSPASPWPEPTDLGASAWLRANPGVWSAYLAWLDRNNLRPAELLAEFGIDGSAVVADWQRRTEGRTGHDDQLLRAVPNGEARTRTGRDDRDGPQLGPGNSVEQERTGLAVRSGVGGADPGRSGVQPSLLDGGTSDGGNDGDRFDRGTAARRGDDQMDPPASGGPTRPRGVTAARNGAFGAGPSGRWAAGMSDRQEAPGRTLGGGREPAG